MMKHFTVSLALFAMTTLSWAAVPPSTPSAAGAAGVHLATPAQTPAAFEPAYQSYKYMGDHYRDPFIPLTGNTFDATDRGPQVSSLSLKGIIEDAKGRVAVLSNGASSYILRAGRLYDGRNRVVKGISGVVKVRSVVLVGSDRTVKELSIDKTAL